MIFNFSVLITAVCLIFLINEMCMYNFGCNPSNFVVDHELFFFRVRHLKMKEERINPLPLQKSLLTNAAILHAFDWLFEATL